jgi:hypothetical protein
MTMTTSQKAMLISEDDRAPPFFSTWSFPSGLGQYSPKEGLHAPCTCLTHQQMQHRAIDLPD